MRATYFLRQEYDNYIKNQDPDDDSEKKTSDGEHNIDISLVMNNFHPYPGFSWGAWGLELRRGEEGGEGSIGEGRGGFAAEVVNWEIAWKVCGIVACRGSRRIAAIDSVVTGGSAFSGDGESWQVGRYGHADVFAGVGKPSLVGGEVGTAPK